MCIAKFHRLFTACICFFCFSGCVSHTTQYDFDRQEALKARISLAIAYLEQDEFSKARENIDRALAHNPDDYLPHSLLSYYYQRLNQIELAIQSYQTALALSRKQNNTLQPSPDVLNNYGTFLCHLQQFEQAHQLFEQALKSNSPYYHQIETLENVIHCAIQATDMIKAEQYLGHLHSLSPDKAQKLKDIISNKRN